MKFVIAPDKFKNSLTGFEFCDAVEQGLKKVNPNFKIIKMPLADGGDGTLDVLQHYLKGEKITLTAADPLFRPIDTFYIYNSAERIAYIEMANISGLQLLSLEERNCLQTTSLGTGELLVDAIERGAKTLILGIGGSATNDGGMGIAHAMGFRFISSENATLQPIGKNLNAVKKIDRTNVHPKLASVAIKVACDVTNQFSGKNGAAYVYASQKGASKSEIVELDVGLVNFAHVLKLTFHVEVQNIKGAGAAGGVGGGVYAMLGGQLLSGANLIKELANFDKAIENADWIITGEGKLDHQTFSGKTIAGILETTQSKNISVAALCGSIEISKEKAKHFGLDYIASISEHCKNLEEAISNAHFNLVHAAEQFGVHLLTKRQ